MVNVCYGYSSEVPHSADTSTEELIISTQLMFYGEILEHNFYLSVITTHPALFVINTKSIHSWKISAKI